IIPCEYCVTTEENKSLTEDVNKSLTEIVGEMEKNETLTEDVVGETEKNERLVKDVASLSSGDNALASPPPRPKTRRKLTAPRRRSSRERKPVRRFSPS
ncbi:hypothetical protein L195_g058177, partial [Trifolium pratense]